MERKKKLKTVQQRQLHATVTECYSLKNKKNWALLLCSLSDYDVAWKNKEFQRPTTEARERAECCWTHCKYVQVFINKDAGPSILGITNHSNF